jgi:hypothetical protein
VSAHRSEDALRPAAQCQHRGTHHQSCVLEVADNVPSAITGHPWVLWAPVQAQALRLLGDCHCQAMPLPAAGKHAVSLLFAKLARHPLLLRQLRAASADQESHVWSHQDAASAGLAQADLLLVAHHSSKSGLGLLGTCLQQASGSSRLLYLHKSVNRWESHQHLSLRSLVQIQYTGHLEARPLARPQYLCAIHGQALCVRANIKYLLLLPDTKKRAMLLPSITQSASFAMCVCRGPQSVGIHEDSEHANHRYTTSHTYDAEIGSASKTVPSPNGLTWCWENRTRRIWNVHMRASTRVQFCDAATSLGSYGSGMRQLCMP